MTLAENESCWREAKRAKRASASAGTGTASSTASCTVHRPIPESSTYPSMEASSGSSFKARARRSRSQDRTTAPWVHTAAIRGRSRSKSLASSIANPSPYACGIAYSMALWIIFV
jgi:hypothetical protein